MRKALPKVLIGAIGMIVVLFSLRSVFHPSFFPTHDFTHVARISEMDRAVKDGQLPVRWSENLGYGYGMPLFNFYGPLPFYTAEIAVLAGSRYLSAIKLLLIFTGILGFFGMYAWSSRWLGRAGGLVAAVAFTLIPYRALDIFVRGAFNELFAISMVPWVLFSFEKLRQGKSVKWAGIAAISLVGIFVSHNLMTMIFLPVVYLYGWLTAVFSKNWKKTALLQHLAIGLGLLLSAFYVLPAFLEKNFTQVDKLIGGYGHYSFHFLYIRQFFIGDWGFGGSILGIEDGLSFKLGGAHVLLSALGIAAVLLSKAASSRKRKILFLSLGFVTAVSLFMATFKSSFIWDVVPILAYIQFPWRFLSVAAVTVPFFVGASIFAIRGKRKRMFFVAFVIFLLFLFNDTYFKPKEYLSDPEALYYSEPRRISERMSGILPDYIPASVKELPETRLDQPRVFVSAGGVRENRFELIADRTHELLFRFTTDESTEITLNVFWFPGWKAYDNGMEVPLETEEPFGRMKLRFGRGDHLVSVKFEDTPVRTLGNTLTVLGGVGVLGVFAYARRKRD